MNTQFISAIEQICDEKGLSKEIVLEAIEAALAAAYKKDYGDRDQEVRVQLDEATGEPRIFVSKEVTDEVENPFLQITVTDAQKYKKGAKVEDTVEYEEDNKDFGRVAAQTAKQVIVQRIREAEREVVFAEYSDKEDTILNAVVQRIEGNNVFVDLGKASGIMFPAEQIRGEHYYPGQRLKVYIVRVEQTARGPQIVVSRSHPDMIRRLFEMEVPEIETGNVEIMGIAREGGARTKIAVRSNADGVDAVGTFVGGRGARVQAVMADLGEEKIDIIPFSEDDKAFIASALSPTKVISVTLDEAEKKAVVRVPEDQLSLAIGRQGQNVRLAAKLTGWNVDIESADDAGIEATAEVAAAEPATEETPVTTEAPAEEAVADTAEAPAEDAKTEE
jgi:N utilization substance protein A